MKHKQTVQKYRRRELNLRSNLLHLLELVQFRRIQCLHRNMKRTITHRLSHEIGQFFFQVQYGYLEFHKWNVQNSNQIRGCRQSAHKTTAINPSDQAPNIPFSQLRLAADRSIIRGSYLNKNLEPVFPIWGQIPMLLGHLWSPNGRKQEWKHNAHKDFLNRFVFCLCDVCVGGGGRKPPFWVPGVQPPVASEVKKYHS